MPEQESVDNSTSNPELEKKADLIWEAFKKIGKPLLAYNGQYVYEADERPDGAVDNYTSIDSDLARQWIAQSMEDGYNYNNMLEANTKNQ